MHRVLSNHMWTDPSASAYSQHLRRRLCTKTHLHVMFQLRLGGAATASQFKFSPGKYKFMTYHYIFKGTLLKSTPQYVLFFLVSSIFEQLSYKRNQLKNLKQTAKKKVYLFFFCLFLLNRNI